MALLFNTQAEKDNFVKGAGTSYPDKDLRPPSSTDQNGDLAANWPTPEQQKYNKDKEAYYDQQNKTGPGDPGYGDVPTNLKDTSQPVGPGVGGGLGGGNIWDPIGYGDDLMDFDTRPPNPGEVPNFPWFPGDGGPNVTTQQPGANGNTLTQLNPDGSVTPGVVDPTTRSVMDEELTSEQLSKLLRSDSKFIQDARRQGLEQANAVGGLGGTAAAGASMQAAIRTAMPVAQEDAAAFRQAASENMTALNQFAQLNHQRSTQLELGQIDARTRQLTTQISTSAQMAAAKLQSATQRDLGRLDSETRLRAQEMQGKIQDRLATQQFKYSALLNDAQYAAELAKTSMQGEYGLAGTGLQGQWNKAIQDATNEAQREGQYLQLMTGAYDGYLNRLAELNGIEMDDNARQRAIASITAGTRSMFDLLSKMFPGVPPIEFELG